MNVNLAVLAGRLARDPEIRYTPKGSAVCKFSLAVGREWKDDAGQKKEEVSFLDVTAFAKVAEAVQKYLRKGNLAHVVGRLKQETWDDKDSGQKRSRIVVIAEQVQFGPKPTSTSDSGQPAAPNAPAAPPSSATGQADDIPF